MTGAPTNSGSRRIGLVLALVLAWLAQAPAWGGTDDLDRAWLKLQRGDSLGVVQLTSEAIAAGGLGDEEVAAAYNLRGLAFMQRQDFTNALADFDLAAALRPDFTSALVNRGLARAKLEQYDAAVDDFSRALGLAPGMPEVYFMRGNARFDKGDYPAAIADYGQTLAGKPDHWMARTNRCDALGRLGRLDEARADCARAKATAPDKEAVERVERALGQPCDCQVR